VSGGPSEGAGRLGVVVDGAALGEEEARAMWQKFSAYMEEHKGDLAGFAKAEGFASVHPRSDGGRAVLVMSKTEPQEAYGAVPKPVGGTAGAGAAGGKRRRKR
jgi:hypothetical protein